MVHGLLVNFVTMQCSHFLNPSVLSQFDTSIPWKTDVPTIMESYASGKPQSVQLARPSSVEPRVAQSMGECTVQKSTAASL